MKTREEYLAAERARHQTDDYRLRVRRRYHSMTKEQRAENYRKRQLANPPSNDVLAKRRARSKAWRDAHPGYHSERLKAWSATDKGRASFERAAEKRRLRRAEITAMANELKRKPCKDCGCCFHPVAMDYDHRDPAEKCAAPSEAKSLGKEFYLAEIAKCDLVCANCHRLREHNRRNGLPGPPTEPEYFI